MPIARRLLVDRSSPGIYHCISRCVRRAFLCGDGFDHRKDWIRDRLQELAGLFAVDVGGYAIMDNHLHVVLRTSPDIAAGWTAVEVARRWHGLFPARIRCWGEERGAVQEGEAARGGEGSGEPGESVEADERAILAVAGDESRIVELRSRLSDLSWFMKCLKEPIARRANREDDCTGHFWEGRFKSPRVLDLPALLTCLVYVDLNVVRALKAVTPEESTHTSVHDRIRLRQRCDPAVPPQSPEPGIWLAPIDMRVNQRGLLPMSEEDYLLVVDLTGRAVREEKAGAIPTQLPGILARLGIEAAGWLGAQRNPGRLFGTAIGSAAHRAAEAARRGVKWVAGALEVSVPSPTQTVPA